MPTPIKILETDDVTTQALEDRTVAVLGYGAQGHAHALNLRDSGLTVIVAQRKGSPRYERAVEDGFEPVSIVDAVQAADLLIFGLPDDEAGEIFVEQIAPHLRPGQALGFIHGFAIHYELIVPPDNVDVVLVAPKAQGRGVRNEYLARRGVLSLIAVHQDATGGARDTALAWAAGIGSHRAGLIETTFADETETDLFGEQAVLCGGLTALIKAGFETLVEAGYPAELAYFECCHEIKLLADLIYEHGIAGMRDRISSPARFGDVTRGERVIGDQTRAAMRSLLAEVQSGQFTDELLADTRSGGAQARQLIARDHAARLETTGRAMRKLLWGK